MDAIDFSSDRGGRLVIVVMRAVIQFESWICEQVFPHERISRGVGPLLMTFN